jgi:hypothetical protein
MTIFSAQHHRSARSSNPGNHRTGSIFIVCSLFGFSPLAAQAGPENDRVVLRKQEAQSTDGPFSVTASCESDEIRLGGGYKLSQPALNSDALSVEGNYPSGSRSWTVSGSHYGQDESAHFISAEVYCIKSAGASVQTVASPVIRSEPDGQGFFRAESQAVCPGDTILTGGGFRTSATELQSGIHNAWLSAFLPVQNASGEARGWRATIDAIQWIEPSPRPTLQTFVVCANPSIGPDPITSGGVISSDIPSRPLVGFTYLGPRTVQCPAGEIALSGGYNFGDSNTGHADLFVPHQIIESHTYSSPRIIQRELATNPKPSATETIADLGFTASILTPTAPQETKSRRPGDRFRPALSTPRSPGTTTSGGTSGKNTEESDTSRPSRFDRDELVIGPTGDVLAPETNPFVDFGGWTVGGIFGSSTQSQTFTGHAACFNLPEVRFDVEILTPEFGFSVGPDFSTGGNGTTTTPVSMTAIATGSNGQAVADITYTWMVDGVTVGSGASLSSPIATQECGVDSQTVKVVASDADGRSASDEVTIMVGRIC